MAFIEPQPQQQSGKLVALEGDVDTVQTQIRLLPPSQKILVLPAFLEQIPRDTNAETFDARSFIRDVHTSFIKRTEQARSFLQSSTAAQPRLVFMNGGSVTARATCITRICENITGEDIGEAEIIFNEIVKDGVAGLMKHQEVAEAEVERKADADEVDNQARDVDRDGARDEEERVEDPSLKAMRAADSLDRETAELQDEEPAVITATGINKDAKHEHLGAKDDFNKSEAGDIVRTVVTVPIRDRPEKKIDSQYQPSATLTTPFAVPAGYSVTPSQQAEGDYDDAYDDDYDSGLLSPGGDSILSAPHTPKVVYGEARVVDVQSQSPKNTMRRIKSFDRFFPSKPTHTDWITSHHGSLKHAKSAYHLGRPPTPKGRIQSEEDYIGFQTLPRTTFVKASTTTIKKPSISSLTTNSKVCRYVDRGTDAEEVGMVEDLGKSAPFEPVFPLVEDLVIHFNHGTPNNIFEYVISTYKTGSYPILPSLPESEYSESDRSQSPVSPVSPISSVGASEQDPTFRPTSHLTAETDDDGFHRRHEFDPYANNNYPGCSNPWLSKHKPTRSENPGQNFEPPTPTTTPPPMAKAIGPISTGIEDKFCEFSPMNPNSAIGVQNSLRSLLNLHFPAGKNGYTQYSFTVSPESDRLWKPVFRNDETPSIGSEGRTVDQIIALGCEEGVKKDFFTQVSGQIERLGMKRDGFNRSSKIDLTYFISIVMQSHSDLTPSTQNSSNPFSSPEILATYIVPQLEAYLAANTSTRLLILHYPYDQLATIIALRKLLGQDVLKVAGVMDSLSSDPPSISRRPINPLSNDAISRRSQRPRAGSYDIPQRNGSIVSLETSNHKQKKSESSVSFSKANYLLPSMATEAEISTFLSGMSISLMEKSPFYTPEPEPKPIIIEKPALPPTPTTVTSRDTSRDAHPPVSLRKGGGIQSRESKIARLTGNADIGPSVRPKSPGNSSGHKYAASIASTRTTATERVRREDAKVEKDWENFYIGDVDSDDDDYDRMVMGRALAKIIPEVRRPTMDGKAPKRSTKKALKWLGLA